MLPSTLKKIKLITLGCSKNRVDSEHLLRQIARNGFDVEVIEQNDQAKGADLLLVNTCGFIHDAKKESIEVILSAVEDKKNGDIGQIFVFGCLSQRYPFELKESIPEVDRFFGVFDREAVLAALGGIWDNNFSHERHLTTPSHYAFLKISEGCDRSCSYCSIPLIRGGHTSIPEDQLFREAELLADSGVKELVIVAQDTTYYGIDTEGEKRIASLIEKLSGIKSIEWIRMLYAYPAGFPEDLLKVMSDNPKVCKYLDIPLQHISDKVLSAMRRGVDSKNVRSLVQRFREKVPGIVLRTTMMVGHPGEGKREFEELLKFVEDARFERLGAFEYSQEEGTWGASNLRDRISKAEKSERYGRLMELQSAISLEYNTTRIGSSERVLIDRVEEGLPAGRTSKEAPEVDGEVIIRGWGENGDINKLIGKFVTVEVTEADEYDLFSKILY